MITLKTEITDINTQIIKFLEGFTKGFFNVKLLRWSLHPLTVKEV